MAIRGNTNNDKAGRSLLFIYFALSACVLFSSFVVSNYQKKYFESEQIELLSFISKMKSIEIKKWYQENLNTANSIFNNPDLLTRVRKYLLKHDDPILGKKLRERIDSISGQTSYKCISILDSNYNVILKCNKDNFNISTNDIQHLGKINTTKEIVITDPQKVEYDKNIYINLIIPIILGEKKNNGKPDGIILCQINPNPFFNLLMKSLPVQGKTEECFLLKRTEDSLVCINELGYEDNTGLKSGLPVLSKDLTVEKILNGKSVVEHGIDYNGKEVIFYCQEVTGTPWYFLTKIDVDESPGSIRISSIYINILTLLSLLTLGFGLGFYWKTRAKIQKQQEYDFRNSEVNNKEEIEHRENEIKHNVLFETMFQGVIYTDNNGVIIAANPAAEKLFGLNLEEMKNHSIDDEIWQVVKYDGTKYEKNNNPIIHALKTGYEVKNAIMGIYNSLRKKRCWLIVNVVPLFKNNQIEPYQVYATFEDITERLSYEEQIKNSLVEKEVLLKEIHHRVKNNLQIITSILNLNEDFLKDKKSHDIFIDIQTRVRSMSLIHELMYKQENFLALNIKDYIENMIKFLCDTYIDNRNRITVVSNVDNVELDMDSIIHYGLIINELITNCLKHSFPNGSKGSIYITFKVENDKYILSISDDGVGIPEDFDIQNLNSFGLKLVIINAKQLKGEMNIIRKEKGVEFKMVFGRLSHGLK